MFICFNGAQREVYDSVATKTAQPFIFQS